MNIQAATQRLQEMAAVQSNIEEIIETSRHFWKVEDYDEIARVGAEFVKYHQAIVAELKQQWGEPTFEGNWKDANFPEWAAPKASVLLIGNTVYRQLMSRCNSTIKSYRSFW